MAQLIVNNFNNKEVMVESFADRYAVQSMTDALREETARLRHELSVLWECFVRLKREGKGT